MSLEIIDNESGGAGGARSGGAAAFGVDGVDGSDGVHAVGPADDVLALPSWERPPWAAAIAVLATAVAVLVLSGWPLPFGSAP